MTDRRTYTVDEAAQQLGISRNACYDAIRRGDIPNLRIGHRIVVPKAAFDRMLEVGEPAHKNPTEAGGLVGSGSAKS
jgi:excisionase family DNA binding protein